MWEQNKQHPRRTLREKIFSIKNLKIRERELIFRLSLIQRVNNTFRDENGHQQVVFDNYVRSLSTNATFCRIFIYTRHNSAMSWKSRCIYLNITAILKLLIYLIRMTIIFVIPAFFIIICLVQQNYFQICIKLKF
jgi:hypothetical protein